MTKTGVFTDHFHEEFKKNLPMGLFLILLVGATLFLGIAVAWKWKNSGPRKHASPSAAKASFKTPSAASNDITAPIHVPKRYWREVIERQNNELLRNAEEKRAIQRDPFAAMAPKEPNGPKTIP